jgi:TolA-binding protein
METGAEEVLGSLSDSVGRLSATTSLLERTLAWLEERQNAMSGDVQKIVAAVEQVAADGTTARERELEEKLRAAEQEIVELRAQAGRSAERKTLPATTMQLLEKRGIEQGTAIEAGALDAALYGLILEQRIAVKSQLLRAGWMS